MQIRYICSDLTDSAVFRLEETLQILEECLQTDETPFPASNISYHHVKKLKEFYSPDFEIDHSESGSYFFATLRSISKCYIEPDGKYHITLSDKLKYSLEILLSVSMTGLNLCGNHHTIVDNLVDLAELWELNDTMDMHTLLISIITRMRADLITCSEK